MKKHSLSEESFFKPIKNIHIAGFVLITIATFIIYYILITNSLIDETILYSWAWIVNYFNISIFFVLLFLICVISFFIAKINFKIKQLHFLIIIFLLAFSLSAFTWHLSNPNPDMAEFFGIAKYVEVNGVFGYLKDFGTNNLRGYRFYSFLPIIGVGFLIFGESPFVAHFITSILCAFIPVLVFLLSKRLFDKKIAFIASFFIISIPIMLIQSSMFLVDVPTIFFVLLALLSFHTFLVNNSFKKSLWYYPLSIVTLLFAIGSKTSAILFLFFSFLVIFLIVKKSDDFKINHLSMKTLFMLGITFLIICIFVFLKFNFFLVQLPFDLTQANILGNPDIRVNSLSYFFQIQPLIMFLFLASLVFFVLKPSLSKLFLLVWIFFPFIFLYDTTVRYMFPSFPAIAIAAAFMLSKFKKPLVVFVVSVIFLSSTLSVIMGYVPLLKHEFYDNNIMLIADYTNKLNVNNAGVYMFYNNSEYKNSPKTEIYGYMFDYYSSKRVYYDISDSVKQVYNGNRSRFNVFEYYKDEFYLSPNYDLIVVFSDVYNYQELNFSDVKKITSALNNGYELKKSFSEGLSGVESNKFAFVYSKKS